VLQSSRRDSKIRSLVSVGLAHVLDTVLLCGGIVGQVDAGGACHDGGTIIVRLAGLPQQDAGVGGESELGRAEGRNGVDDGRLGLIQLAVVVGPVSGGLSVEVAAGLTLRTVSVRGQRLLPR